MKSGRVVFFNQKPMEEKPYSERLKDPRWQKKRLEILQRDKFECQNCYRFDVPLHVHHKKYNTKDPWDIDPFFLITLCEDCHKQEPDQMNSRMYELRGFFMDIGLCSIDIDTITSYFTAMDENVVFRNLDNFLELMTFVANEPEALRFLTALKKNRDSNGELKKAM